MANCIIWIHADDYTYGNNSSANNNIFAEYIATRCMFPYALFYETVSTSLAEHKAGPKFGLC